MDTVLKKIAEFSKNLSAGAADRKTWALCFDRSYTAFTLFSRLYNRVMCSEVKHEDHY